MESTTQSGETPREEDDLWEQIELSERYLVSCMYGEASSLSAFVLQKLCCGGTPTKLDCTSHQSKEDEATLDMVEAAGMVFVQAYNGNNRTSDIFQDLKTFFGSVALIPWSVLFTGLCMQIHEGDIVIAQNILDEFFTGWIFSKGDSCYILSEAERKMLSWNRIWSCTHLPRKEYLQIVELYALNVLAKGFKNEELALNWLEKADILEEERQDISRKIRSFFSLREANSATSFSHTLTSYKREEYKDKGDSHSNVDTGVLQMGKASSEIIEHAKGVEICKTFAQNQVLSRISGLLESLSLWFPTIAVKMGNLRRKLPQRNFIFIWVAVFLLIFILKRKSEFVKRSLRGRLRALHRSITDFYQLAFNVQVNPLAAVQPLPSAPYVGR